MPQFVRRSLLVQLVSVYLLFVVVVLVVGAVVNAIVDQRVRDEVQASDQALAQEIALDTSLKLTGAETAVVTLGRLAQTAGSRDALARDFQAFMAARSDVDHVYWLDPLGGVQLSVQSPIQAPDITNLPPEFSPPGVVEQALVASGPIVEVGIAAETTFSAGVIIAEPVRTPQQGLVGIVAISLSLSELSAPLKSVVDAQARQHQLQISIIDDRGVLIASPDSTQILFNVLNELPGASQALGGHPASQLGPGPGGQEWLYSATPVPKTGWAVVVQRPTSEALAVVAQFHLWLLMAALIFALGGLVFWLMLLSRVISPLHALAVQQHPALPGSEHPILPHATTLASRDDEVGGLARSLARLERDVLAQLGELHTLLKTSTAVVESLDPRDVVGTIIREAGRLVDVQAAAVLVPDEHDVLRVLVSDGHTEHYDHALSLAPENADSAAVTALRDGRPVQKLLDPGQLHPSLSSAEGFRTVLAIPIVSRHAGAVVLLVHRTESQPFTENEVDLLLTFANYATLAWEHAVLYERSDERLREVARENERLYRESSDERQRLAAIMGSMRDGLVLTGIDGTILYANPGASAISGISSAGLERHHVNTLFVALGASALDPAACEQALARVEAAAASEAVIEIQRDARRRAIHLRPFDVSDDSGQVIGRGLLLRDVTREREIAEFKTTLLAAVGHELRTPLAAIKGHASTLLQDDVTWPLDDQRHFLRTISAEADRLAQLVSNLLDLSRQEAGLLLLKRTPTQIRELVVRAVEQVSQPGVAIAVQIPDDLPALDVDRARIEVVLHNLLTNAITYGKGEVYVTAERRGAALVVSVSDNGPGLAPDELSHAFERFYRAQHGRRQRSGGTGLGLAICKAFVEAHGGSIWAESNGAHTVISFSLPLAAPDGHSTLDIETSDAAPQAHQAGEASQASIERSRA